MTLYDIIQALEGIAKKQLTVKMIVQNDIYDLNDKADARYGVFGWTQGQHSADGDIITYAFTLFYVDRLDESRDNRTFVQSTGVSTIANILYTLSDEFPVEIASSTFDTFTEKFSDECAGVMASVNIVAPRPIVCAIKDFE